MLRDIAESAKVDGLENGSKHRERLIQHVTGCENVSLAVSLTFDLSPEAGPTRACKAREPPPPCNLFRLHGHETEQSSVA